MKPARLLSLSKLCGHQCPPNHKKLHQFDPLLQFSFNQDNQFFPLPVYFVLSFETCVRPSPAADFAYESTTMGTSYNFLNSPQPFENSGPASFLPHHNRNQSFLCQPIPCLLFAGFSAEAFQLSNEHNRYLENIFTIQRVPMKQKEGTVAGAEQEGNYRP